MLSLSNLPWKWLGLGLAIAFLATAIDRRGYDRGRHSRDAEVMALQNDTAMLKAASASAAAENDAHVLTVERAAARIAKEQDNALSRQNDNAHAAAERYIGLHPSAAAYRGDAGDDPLSEPADAAGAAVADPQPTVVAADDVRSCTEWVIIGMGWQRWWAEVSALPR